MKKFKLLSLLTAAAMAASLVVPFGIASAADEATETVYNFSELTNASYAKGGEAVFGGKITISGEESIVPQGSEGNEGYTVQTPLGASVKFTSALKVKRLAVKLNLKAGETVYEYYRGSGSGGTDKKALTMVVKDSDGKNVATEDTDESKEMKPYEISYTAEKDGEYTIVDTTTGSYRTLVYGVVVVTPAGSGEGGGEVDPDPEEPTELVALTEKTTFDKDVFSTLPAGKIADSQLFVNGTLQIVGAGTGSEVEITATQIKLGGSAKSNNTQRVVNILPGTAGTVTVNATHANTSDQDRWLNIYESGSQIGDSLYLNGAENGYKRTDEITVNVKGNEVISIGSGNSGININSIVYEPTTVVEPETSNDATWVEDVIDYSGPDSSIWAADFTGLDGTYTATASAELTSGQKKDSNNSETIDTVLTGANVKIAVVVNKAFKEIKNIAITLTQN